MGWALCRPVMLQNRVLGVIYLDNKLVDLSPPETEIAFLEVILNHVAVALDNAQAYEEIIQLKERLEDENRFYRIEMESSASVGSIIGKSTGIQRVLAQAKQVAPTDTTVLVHGETGVGKELVARAIHKLSPRRGGPLHIRKRRVVGVRRHQQRIIRARKGLVHGRNSHPARAFRAGRRRYPLPG